MTRAIAVLVARIIFSFVFFMAAGFKFADMGATATYIASAGFPMAGFLAWVAAFFELALGARPDNRRLLHGSEPACCRLCHLPGVRLSWPVALGGQSGGIRLLHRPLHLLRRAAVCRRARTGKMGNLSQSGEALELLASLLRYRSTPEPSAPFERGPNILSEVSRDPVSTATFAGDRRHILRRIAIPEALPLLECAQSAARASML